MLLSSVRAARPGGPRPVWPVPALAGHGQIMPGRPPRAHREDASFERRGRIGKD
ncbi:MAG: hypothetical protein AVDCRST_MAG59-2830 [uncultured Thermomicrobiales bacterium]|uniref:Uncharacterized protein n=1 Tax=uncultured Thermomicrobiales bacterium TaxID=1645740 RepID=A0A6J4UZK7_9BACT|nr:MAG: hypothetical protein AVDCRST_MAG59-2830 [uncultured Thermomicrobiales bacterium]